MRLQINPDKLTDSPYKETTKELFLFDSDSVNDLVQDIKFGQPTCYLISGYRGSGKSSFIAKVEDEVINEKNETSQSGNQSKKKNDKQLGELNKITPNNKLIFVHTNFARYESRTYL